MRVTRALHLDFRTENAPGWNEAGTIALRADTAVFTSYVSEVIGNITQPTPKERFC